MRRAGPQAFVPVVLACALPLAGCGGSGSRHADALTFEALPDSGASAAGPALLQSFEPYRMANGALRVRGRIAFPDGTRLQIAIRRPGERTSVAMVQVFVQDGGFDSPPMLGDRGPLPVGRYTFSLEAQFDAGWQPPQVLAATDDGRALRGPGMVRRRDGRPEFAATREWTR
ncbi:MAG TPA: hypothetical protein VGU27_07755 [Candidatus Eisenbacteria bacterium]|nr:hypothetical protein [Candidatus Eisenbacteria bacterium]